MLHNICKCFILRVSRSSDVENNSVTYRLQTLIETDPVNTSSRRVFSEICTNYPKDCSENLFR